MKNKASYFALLVFSDIMHDMHCKYDRSLLIYNINVVFIQYFVTEGLRFLRAIRLMSIPDILQYMNVLRTSNSIRFMQLVTIFLSVWLAATGFIHIVSTCI